MLVFLALLLALPVRAERLLSEGICSTGNSIFVSSLTTRVGIGNCTPGAFPLDVTGTVRATTFSGSGALLTAIPSAGLDASSVTLQGNTFNAASKLVQLDGSAKVPNSLLDSSSATLLGPAIDLSGSEATGDLPAARIAAGSLGASVIASSITAGTALPAADLTGTISAARMDSSSVTMLGPSIDLSGVEATGDLPAARLAAGSLGASVIASSLTATVPFPAAYVQAGSLGASVLVSSLTAVTMAGTYGSSTVIPTLTVNAQGQVVSLSSNSVTAGTSYPLDLATSTNIIAGVYLTLASSASATSFTFDTSAALIRITSTAAARAITIAAAQNVAGRVLVIKDEGGLAGTNNITVTPESGTIDGQATMPIIANFGTMRLYGDGTNWHVW